MTANIIIFVLVYTVLCIAGSAGLAYMGYWMAWRCLKAEPLIEEKADDNLPAQAAEYDEDEDLPSPAQMNKQFAEDQEDFDDATL